jgi:choline-sulfatase
MRFLRRQLIVLILALAASAAPALKASSAPPAGSRLPNIILITLDTTRADRMGFLGSKRGLTPNLDALALQGLIFTRAYAQVPLTSPSHASLLTGTYPQFNNIEDMGSPLRPDLPYLPALLHEHGYQTVAFVGAIVLDAASKQAPGFDRGFDLYDARFHQRKLGEDRYHSIERRAEDVGARAIDWLSHRQQKPFFLWAHFYDAHDPYDSPEPFKTKYASDPYDGEIAYVDSVVGQLLNVLRSRGLYKDAVIAIAADHGEAFGEHGEERHGMFLYDETIHVPLLLKLPAGRPGAKPTEGTRINQRVGLVDLAPSLLETAGIAVPAAMQGQSLFPLIDQAKADAATSQASSTGKASERSVYSESNYAHQFGWAELRSWRAGKYLYVQAPRRELYDQSLDPNALRNLASASIAVSDTLQSQLTSFHQKAGSAQTETAKLDPAQAEQLRALGYMASDSTTARDTEKGAIDPKDKIEIANRFHRAAVDFEEDRYEEGIATLRHLLRMEPDMATVYMELGRALLHEHRVEEALPAYRTAVEKAPESATAHYELGLALVKAKQWEAALPEAQTAVKYAPESAQLHFFLGIVQLHLKHVPEATTELENSLKIDPDHFPANLKYGEMLLLEGHPDAALPKLSRAVQLDPESAEAHKFLADTYQQLGHTDEAGRERAKAVVAKGQATE